MYCYNYNRVYDAVQTRLLRQWEHGDRNQQQQQRQQLRKTVNLNEMSAELLANKDERRGALMDMVLPGIV